MIDPHDERRMHDVLDGVATADERSRLESWLAGNEAGRARFRELEALYATLSRAPLADAPPDLRPRVLAAIPAAPAGTLERWAAFLSRRPAAALGLPFAAGLAAGAIGLALWTGLPGTGPDRTSHDVVGSMAPAGARVAEIVHWRAGEAEVVARVVRNGRTLEAQLEARNPVTIALDFDLTGWKPGNLRRDHPESGTLSLDPGRIVIRSPGNETLSLELVEIGATRPPVRVTLTGTGGTTEAALPAVPAADGSR